jgi:hypothetical protein
MKQNFSRAPFAAITLILAAFTGCVSKPAETKTQPQVEPPQISQQTNAVPSHSAPKTISLFNGKNLDGWKETDFGGRGVVTVENREIKMSMGAELTGINWTNAAVLPKSNYEIELDAMKVDGTDFFCGLTMPFGNSFCTLIVGGWGGGVVGISSINGADASENDSTRMMNFETNRWYHIRVRVTPEKIATWIDGENVIDVPIEGRKVSMRGGEIEDSIPLGIATWQTSAAFKNIWLKTF